MADILIRGVDMPDGCHNCGFSHFEKGETNGGEPCTVLMCSIINQGTNGADYDGNRPSWCPLVPLPEGHGRLGDLDKINASLEAMIDIEHNQKAAPHSWSHAYMEMQSILDDAPTIVPAEGGTDNGF